MVTHAPARPADGFTGTRRRASIVWRTFGTHRGAVVGTLVLLLWVGVAVFAATWPCPTRWR